MDLVTFSGNNINSKKYYYARKPVNQCKGFGRPDREQQSGTSVQYHQILKRQKKSIRTKTQNAVNYTMISFGFATILY